MINDYKRIEEILEYVKEIRELMVQMDIWHVDIWKNEIELTGNSKVFGFNYEYYIANQNTGSVAYKAKGKVGAENITLLAWTDK